MEKVAMWEATTKAMGLFMGHSPESVSKLVEHLKIPLLERVSQESYNMRRIRSKLYARLKEIRTKDKYMDILDEMTV